MSTCVQCYSANTAAISILACGHAVCSTCMQEASGCSVCDPSTAARRRRAARHRQAARHSDPAVKVISPVGDYHAGRNSRSSFRLPVVALHTIAFAAPLLLSYYVWVVSYENAQSIPTTCRTLYCNGKSFTLVEFQDRGGHTRIGKANPGDVSCQGCSEVYACWYSTVWDDSVSLAPNETRRIMHAALNTAMTLMLAYLVVAACCLWYWESELRK